MKFLTHERFIADVHRLQAQFPSSAHWGDGRWVYHDAAVQILRRRVPDVGKVLEIGTMGISLVSGSDIMDYYVSNADWPVTNPTYLHDAKVTPWPIADKEYDLLIALRVYHHLAPRQREAFHEAARVARNVLIVVPEAYPDSSIGSRGIAKEQFVEWNGGRLPTEMQSGAYGSLYFWAEADLQGGG